MAVDRIGRPVPRVSPGSAGREDASLIAGVREGDGDALVDLYTRYGTPCFSLARRILGDTQLAQDVVQEVFLALWRNPGAFDPGRGAFSTWILSLTHHKAVDVVRREENLRRRRTSLEAEEPPSAELAPDEEVWMGLRRERLRGAVAELPAQQAEALVLAYFGGYTQREIAGLTGTPLGTVKTRMLAGMRRLRLVLGDSLDAGADDPWRST